MNAPFTEVLPYDQVVCNYTMPFQLYPFQQNTVNELAPLPNAGYYLDMGLGKTICSIVATLYKLMHGADQAYVLMPPVLLNNWAKVIGLIPETSALIYRGTPAQRKKLPLTADFILMSYAIFKLDQDRFQEDLQLFFEAEGRHKHLVVIADEGTALKNIGSGNYKTFRDFTLAHDVMILTGSPLSNPGDGYAYCKLLAPSIYRTQYQFESLHVEERDFFNRVVKWRKLDVLAENMKVNAVRLLKRDVLKDLPPVTIAPLHYELDKKHQKLYEQLADDQFLKLTSGKKIDVTNASALFNALQQVPCNAEHFSDGEMRSTALDVLDELMEELGGAKLVVFVNYRLTSRRMLEYGKKYGAVAIWGETRNPQASLDTFIKDPKCRLLSLQIRSGGYGIDGLQEVCNNMLFLEMPMVPAHFNQAVARLDRVGQVNPVTVRVAVAMKTIQVRLLANLEDKDSIVNTVVRGEKDIRDALKGL